jgi:hypothetical protein
MQARRTATTIIACSALCSTILAGAQNLLDGGPVLGAHTLFSQENQEGTNPAVTNSIATQSSGSMFLAFSAGYASNSAGPIDNKGNVWQRFGQPVFYDHNEAGVFDVTPYLVTAGKGGAGHTLSIAKDGYAEAEITIPFLEIIGANHVQDVAQNYPSGDELRSGTVTTTGPAVLLAFWWGDGDGLTHSAVPNNGFTVIDSFLDLPPLSAVQCAVAYKQVDTAGSYDVTWTQSPDPGAILWLFAFESSDEIFASSFE